MKLYRIITLLVPIWCVVNTPVEAVLPIGRFVDVKLLDDVNIADLSEVTPSTSADGLELFWGVYGPGVVSNVYSASRTSTSEPFGDVRLVFEGENPEDPEQKIDDVEVQTD